MVILGSCPPSWILSLLNCDFLSASIALLLSRPFLHRQPAVCSHTDEQRSEKNQVKEIERGVEKRIEGWRWGEKRRAWGQKTHGRLVQEREQESDRMQERRDKTAEQLQEKDKCAVKCQGYLIH